MIVFVTVDEDAKGRLGRFDGRRSGRRAAVDIFGNCEED